MSGEVHHGSSEVMHAIGNLRELLAAVPGPTSQTHKQPPPPLCTSRCVMLATSVRLEPEGGQEVRGSSGSAPELCPLCIFNDSNHS